MAKLKLRQEIAWFSLQMEKKLREKEKVKIFSWRMYVNEFLFGLLTDEVEELKESIATDLDPEDIIQECIDVANFAMMIVDNVYKDR